MVKVFQLISVAFAAYLLVQPATAQNKAKPTAAVKADKTIRDCDECPELVAIAPGEFMMGTPPGEADARHASIQIPVHKAKVSKSFAIGRTEVTIAQYRAFIEATGYDEYDRGCQYLQNGGWIVGPKISWKNTGFEVTDDHPAGCIAIEDARAYVAWLKQKTGKPYRLPSETEWEYAARAGTQTPAFWKGEWSDACKYQNGGDERLTKAVDGKMPIKDITPCDDGFAYSSPVARFQPNPWGLYDVSGNVAEWMDDCFTSDVNKVPTDGSAYQQPKCAAGLQKGGSWAGNPSLLRSASRLRFMPGRRGIAFGIRVARDIQD
jgi:formylglycine-generating enzyme required for sulfatase activity